MHVISANNDGTLNQLPTPIPIIHGAGPYIIELLYLTVHIEYWVVVDDMRLQYLREYQLQHADPHLQCRTSSMSPEWDDVRACIDSSSYQQRQSTGTWSKQGAI